MSSREKLLKKIENGLRNVRFNEIVKLMKYYGFTYTKTDDGLLFRHNELIRRINVPKPHGRENKVHKPYVEECLIAIDELEHLEKKGG